MLVIEGSAFTRSKLLTDGRHLRKNSLINWYGQGRINQEQHEGGLNNALVRNPSLHETRENDSFPSVQGGLGASEVRYAPLLSCPTLREITGTHPSIQCVVSDVDLCK